MNHTELLKIKEWLNSDDHKEKIKQLIPNSLTHVDNIPAKSYLTSLLNWESKNNEGLWEFLEQQKVLILQENFIKRVE